MAMDNSLVVTRGKVGSGGSSLGWRGQIYGDRNLTLGGEHKMQYIDDVL